MLKVQNGKLEMKHVAFALPEGLYLNLDTRLDSSMLEFVPEKEKGVYLVISLELSQGKAKTTLENFCADCNLVKKSDFLQIKRGSGTAVGLYYGGDDSDEEYYEEIYDFGKEDGVNQFSVMVECNSAEKGMPFLREFLNRPNIKKFFDNIEYR